MPSTSSTQFTRRPKQKRSWHITQTNGHLAHANNWHKGVYNNSDIEFMCTKVANRRDHEPEWEAIPKILGEVNSQYTGYGTTIKAAQAASAQMILDSGHC